MSRGPKRFGGAPLGVGVRGRRILHTGLWSMIAKAAAAANLFLTMPFVFQALGAAEFGVWATLVSLIAFAGFLDFGLGNGAMNMVAAAYGRGDNSDIGAIVQEARRALLVIAAALAVVSTLALPWIPWQRMFGAPDATSMSVRASVAVVLFTVAVAVPLNLANRVQLGMGQGDRAFRWQAIGQAITACLVIALAKVGARLELLVAATVTTPLLASIANNFQLWRSLPAPNRTMRVRDPTIASAICKEGALFFCLQLAAAFAFSADLPLIAAMRGPEEAGAYAIVQRLFSVIPMGLGLVWAPLWPVYRQALAAGDRTWVHRTLRRSLLGAIGLAMVGSLFLSLGFETIARVWFAHPLTVSGWLIVGFAIWCVVDAAGTAIATFLNAAGIMRYQVIVASIFALACLAGKAWSIIHVGTWVLPWVTAIIFLLTNMLPTVLLWPRMMSITKARLY